MISKENLHVRYADRKRYKVDYKAKHLPIKVKVFNPSRESVVW